MNTIYMYFKKTLAKIIWGVFIAVCTGVYIPYHAHAQGLVGNSFKSTVDNVSKFLADTVIPLLVAITFFIVLFNYFMFIWKADNEQEKTKFGAYTLWSIIAFVCMLSIFGIIQIFYGSIFGGQSVVLPQFKASP